MKCNVYVCTLPEVVYHQNPRQLEGLDRMFSSRERAQPDAEAFRAGHCFRCVDWLKRSPERTKFQATVSELHPPILHAAIQVQLSVFPPATLINITQFTFGLIKPPFNCSSYTPSPKPLIDSYDLCTWSLKRVSGYAIHSQPCILLGLWPSNAWHRLTTHQHRVLATFHQTCLAEPLYLTQRVCWTLQPLRCHDKMSLSPTLLACWFPYHCFYFVRHSH